MEGHENVDELARLFQQDLFASSIGVELVDWTGGTATATATAGPDHQNLAGSVHGGFIFSGADAALSVASNSWGRVAVAVSIDIHYMAAAVAGDQLCFVATELGRGRNLATYELEVRRGEKLLATATGVTFRTDNWHFGPDAWSNEWRSQH